MAKRKYAEYQDKYQKENLHIYKMKVNKLTENDINEWLSRKENIQGYLKALIREDMKRDEKNDT